MSRLALLAIGCAALGALPCLAAETQPCADDKRIECIDYRPNDVVHLYAEPGATLRIQLGAGEKVEGLHVSDQRTLAAEEPAAPTRMDAVAERPTGNHSASCDPNLCRSVVENFVYIMPRRELTGQPFFLQTQWCDGAGKCRPVPYAFELQAKAPPSPAAGTRSGISCASAPFTASNIRKPVTPRMVDAAGITTCATVPGFVTTLTGRNAPELVGISELTADMIAW